LRIYDVIIEKEIRIHGELELGGGEGGMEDGPRRQQEIELPSDESSNDGDDEGQ
jgi:hypothetical protein